MSACATGCGRDALPEHFLCPTCNGLWLTSEEGQYPGRHTALVDFCNRARAERQVRNNEGTT